MTVAGMPLRSPLLRDSLADVMPTSSTCVVVDFESPSRFDVPFTRARIGTFDVDLSIEFFRGFVNHAGVTLHIDKHCAA